MRWISFFFILLIATLLEASNILRLPAVDGWLLRPSILITLLVYYAVTCRTHEAISYSFLIGLAADLVSGVLGPHMISYGIIGLLLDSISHTLSMRRATHKALFVFLAFLVTEIAAHWLSVLKLHEIRPNIYSVLFFTALYSAIISPLIWSILSSTVGWSTTKPSKTQHVFH